VSDVQGLLSPCTTAFSSLTFPFLPGVISTSGRSPVSRWYRYRPARLLQKPYQTIHINDVATKARMMTKPIHRRNQNWSSSSVAIGVGVSREVLVSEDMMACLFCNIVVCFVVESSSYALPLLSIPSRSAVLQSRRIVYHLATPALALVPARQRLLAHRTPPSD
jgi:hypothetical protein